MIIPVNARVRPFPLRWPHVGLSVLGLLVLSALAFVIFRPILVLPLIGEAPRYGLTDERGKWLLDTDLRGQIVLYNFTYASRATPCPQTSPVMRGVQDRLGELTAQGIPVALVTISFDAARDTPAALRTYAAQLGADPSRWHFATGKPAELKEVIGRGFKTFYTSESDGTFRFDPVFILVDGGGIIRAEYRTATPNIDYILRDMRLVNEESRNSSGAGRLAYEAAHLFVCYPPR